MEAKIQKWGNSLGIRIPIHIIKDLSLKNGSIVDINEESDMIIIRSKVKFELNEIVDSINDENIHKESDFGLIEGNEIW